MSKVKIKKITYEPVESIVEVDIPNKPTFYFITHIRKSYKVVPRFQDWEGGNNQIFKYDVVEIGLSFETIISIDTITVSSIPQIYLDNKANLHDLVVAMVDGDEEYFRTEKQFNSDFNTAINNINSIILCQKEK